MLIMLQLLVAEVYSLTCSTMLSGIVGIAVEHPNAFYSYDSRVQMFIQTQRDGKDKLEGVNWQMRCVIISMTRNTAVAWWGENYTAARHLRTWAGQGWWRWEPGRLKHECQEIFQSQLLCFRTHPEVFLNFLAYGYVSHENYWNTTLLLWKINIFQDFIQ